jgi:hypothetical protein
MVPLIGGLMTLGSLVGSAFGLGQSAKLNRQRQERINKRRTMNDAYFNKEYYANMSDRAPVKSTMQLIQDRIKQQQAQNASKAAITGATDESQLAASEGQAQAYDQTLKGLAEQETAIKENALSRKASQDAQLENDQAQLDQDKAESTQNLINNAVSLGTSVAGADFSGIEKGLLKKKPDIAGAGNIFKK